MSVHRPRSARRLGIGLVAVALAAACTGEAETAPTTPSPTPIATATSTPSVEATSTPMPSVTEDEVDEARLEELRAGRNFIELAEHDRAPGGRWSEFTYTQFGIAGDGELIGEWTNKRELWDSFVPAFRDECLLAGEPATEPMWDEQLMIPVGVSTLWNDTTTEGRGQFMQMNCVAQVEGEATEFYLGFLVATDEESTGTVTTQMEPIIVRESDYASRDERSADLDRQFWDWVLVQDARS